MPRPALLLLLCSAGGPGCVHGHSRLQTRVTAKPFWTNLKQAITTIPSSEHVCETSAAETHKKLTHTHTRTHAHTHMHTLVPHTCTHVYTLAHTCTCIHMHAHWHTHMHTTYTCTRACTQAHKHSIHTCACAHTHIIDEMILFQLSHKLQQQSVIKGPGTGQQRATRDASDARGKLGRRARRVAGWGRG